MLLSTRQKERQERRDANGAQKSPQAALVPSDLEDWFEGLVDLGVRNPNAYNALGRSLLVRKGEFADDELQRANEAFKKRGRGSQRMIQQHESSITCSFIMIHHDAPLS